MKLSRKAVVVSVVLWMVAIAAGVGFWLRPVAYFDSVMDLKEKFAGVGERDGHGEWHPCPL